MPDARSAAAAGPISPAPRWPRLRAALKQIVGMPDYARYLDHARSQHPRCPLLSEREFYDQYLATRFSGRTTRCC